jgi:hypothetical protein
MLALIICNLMDFSFDRLIDTTRETEWRDSVFTLIGLNLMLLVWAGAWAITGKLIRHHYHFAQQILITSIALTGLIVLLPLLGYIEFISNSTMLSTLFGVLSLLLLIAWLVRFNLYFATSGRHAAVIGLVVSMVMVGGVSTIRFLSQDGFSADAKTINALYPGFTRFGSGASVDSYFDEIESILNRAGQE